MIWTATYKLETRGEPEATGLAANSMSAAACDFGSWRAAHGIAEYYSVTFEESRVPGVTVTPLHEHFSPARLAAVVTEMRARGPLGAPRIRAYFDDVSRTWYALEGTHRLRAAKLLGLSPVMVRALWPRSQDALIRARFAAARRGHVFLCVRIAT